MKKVVLDTNVTISALFWEGNPRKIYDLVRQGKLIMLLKEGDIETRRDGLSRQTEESQRSDQIRSPKYPENLLNSSLNSYG